MAIVKNLFHEYTEGEYVSSGMIFNGETSRSTFLGRKTGFVPEFVTRFEKTLVDLIEPIVEKEKTVCIFIVLWHTTPIGGFSLTF